MKAGAEKLNRVSVSVPAVMNEAWRSFCHQVASFLSYTSVAVQGSEVTNKLSRYKILIKSNGAVKVLSPYSVILLTVEMVSKNCDKQIAFIVRVRSRRNVRFQDKILIRTRKYW